jgi:co-chaperonin GroES (HSP10)|tara:strand:+ start:831 stop:1259 length:429 start_codon:yes stop_codon:yes gene_type:complete
MQQAHMGNSIKNDLWITDEEEVADPDVLPELPGYHVLIRPVSVKSKTKGGIFIPDSTRDDMSYLTTVGRVVSVGDLAYMDKNKFPTGAWCQVGDHVSYGKHLGTKLFYKGVRFILLFDDQITMRVQDPKDLDPTFNLTKGSV